MFLATNLSFLCVSVVLLTKPSCLRDRDWVKFSSLLSTKHLVRGYLVRITEFCGNLLTTVDGHKYFELLYSAANRAN